MEIVISIGVGFLVGMYITSQIKESIECNINQKNLEKNLKEFDKNNKNDR